MRKTFSVLAFLCLLVSCQKELYFDKIPVVSKEPKIYYEASPPGKNAAEIFSMNLDGTGQKKVTNFSHEWTMPYSSANPVVSPDGTRLFFISSLYKPSGELLSMNLDGSDLKKIISPTITGSLLKQFRIFQNGQKILYLLELDSFANKHGEIFTADINGNNQAGLINFPADGNCLNASVDAANSSIVYSNLVAGRIELYAMNTDGTNKRALTSTGISTKMHPQFSPDGSKIIYSAVVSNPGVAYSGFELFVMEASGNNPVQLTNFTQNGTISWYSFGASYSKDGKTIYFSSGETFSISQLYKMNSDGTNIVQLTNDAMDKYFPFIKE